MPILAGFWRLVWVETKVFLREPMGVIGTLLGPVVIFVVLGRSLGTGAAPGEQGLFNVPVLAALLIAISTVISLVAIMAIYREGGILKRLRATPLSPLTILSAHVFIKLASTVISLGLMVLAGRRYFSGEMDVDLLVFGAALLVSTLSILTVGFVVAGMVTTARFVQPVSALVFYPMIAVSGLFFPVERLSWPLSAVAQALPTTHAVTLMQGVWDGVGWNWGSTGALLAIAAVGAGVAARVFRWE